VKGGMKVSSRLNPADEDRPFVNVWDT